jgi:hypothetical protein
MPPNAPFKVVYAVIANGPRRHWLRVGLAFPNRDGSLNVRLDAIPFTGQLQIRDAATRPEGGEPFADPADAVPQTTPPAVPTERNRRS